MILLPQASSLFTCLIRWIARLYVVGDTECVYITCAGAYWPSNLFNSIFIIILCKLAAVLIAGLLSYDIMLSRVSAIDVRDAIGKHQITITQLRPLKIIGLSIT